MSTTSIAAAETTDRGRLLFGPGPSPVLPRVMRALARPVSGHLDPEVVAALDHLRAQLSSLFHAPSDSLVLAVSGTGTAAMEAAVANLIDEHRRVAVVVNGYFGDRLAEMCRRYGAQVDRVESGWGEAADPQRLAAQLRQRPADVVAMVHAETSTGVLNPVDRLAAVARGAGAVTLVDTVTSLGGMPVDVASWNVDACYSAAQKCIGAPSGLSPIVFTPRALDRRVKARTFYLDLELLDHYWTRRQYHHTISSPLVFALEEALTAIEEEGLEARWERHRRHHLAFTAGLEALGLELLPPAADRLWTLHTVRVPAGVDEARIRTGLRDEWNIEIGGGIGPLAGKIWRIGLMGAGASRDAVVLLLDGLDHLIARAQGRAPSGRGTAAALPLLDTRA